MEKIKCPYCEEYVELEVSDHYEGTEIYECPNCEKNFEVNAEPAIHYSSNGKADCLNGAEHNWKQSVGSPDIYFKGKYHCKDCSANKVVKEELATPEEWKEFNRQ